MKWRWLEVSAWARGRARQQRAIIPVCCVRPRWKPNYLCLWETSRFGSSAESSRGFGGFDGPVCWGCKAFWESCTCRRTTDSLSCSFYTCVIPPMNRPLTQLTCCLQEGEEPEGAGWGRGILPAMMLLFGAWKLSVWPGLYWQLWTDLYGLFCLSDWLKHRWFQFQRIEHIEEPCKYTFSDFHCLYKVICFLGGVTLTFSVTNNLSFVWC